MSRPWCLWCAEPCALSHNVAAAAGPPPQCSCTRCCCNAHKTRVCTAQCTCHPPLLPTLCCIADPPSFHHCQNVSLVVLEFAINDPADADIGSPQRRGFELLVRKLLRLPQQPALLLLHHWRYWEASLAGPQGRPVAHWGAASFHSQAVTSTEATLTLIGQVCRGAGTREEQLVISSLPRLLHAPLSYSDPSPLSVL